MLLLALFIPSYLSAAEINLKKLEGIKEIVEESIEQKKIPGAVVLVLNQGKIVYKQAFGNKSLYPSTEPMTTDTIFDLASLTKPIATGTSIFKLVEAGKLRLSDKAKLHLPELTEPAWEAITLEHLLTHTSGLPSGNASSDYKEGITQSIKKINNLKLLAPPGERFTYSDIGFIMLGEIVQRTSGRLLDQFSRDEIFLPLGMKETGYNPSETLKPRIAPTQKEKDGMLRGVVHDPRARLLNGIAGHAGLFSTVDDLALYCAMILNPSNSKVLSHASIRTMTQARAVPNGWRTFGWDCDTAFSSNRGELFPKGSTFGHTGFTGTSIWFDPASQTAVIFLSNRVHPEGKGDATPVRNKVATIVASALDGKPPTTSKQVLSGIEILKRENFARLKGAKVGLVTNHSGRDITGTSTIDLLHQAPEVKLIALFSPDYGIRGPIDAKVTDSKDEKTGLPVYILHRERRKPTPAQLEGIDTLVYDIQDSGCKFNTHIETLGLIMDAASERGIRLMVLDRPNPIGGKSFYGPLPDERKEPFHNIPIRHGLTIGEIAKLFLLERKVTEGKPLVCKLEIVTMENWNRADLFDATGLEWVCPSPNLRTLTTALIYPGVGLLEITNISVGIGTDRPYEWIGAPWMNNLQLALLLNQQNLPGVRFVPVKQTPVSNLYANKSCNGLQILIDNWSTFEPMKTGIAIAWALRKIHPDDWKIEKYNTLLLNKATLDALTAGKHYAEIEKLWRADLAAFETRRKSVLLYPNP
jgi:uncharacterized protein YbbC (DUF1343 family)/CubicO group peptidase (beta-lactamase class C family)